MTNPLRKEPSEFGLNLLRMLLVAILNYATAHCPVTMSSAVVVNSSCFLILKNNVTFQEFTEAIPYFPHTFQTVIKIDVFIHNLFSYLIVCFSHSYCKN